MKPSKNLPVGHPRQEEGGEFIGFGRISLRLSPQSYSDKE